MRATPKLGNILRTDPCETANLTAPHSPALHISTSGTAASLYSSCHTWREHGHALSCST